MSGISSKEPSDFKKIEFGKVGLRKALMIHPPSRERKDGSV